MPLLMYRLCAIDVFVSTVGPVQGPQRGRTAIVWRTRKAFAAVTRYAACACDARCYLLRGCWRRASDFGASTAGVYVGTCSGAVCRSTASTRSAGLAAYSRKRGSVEGKLQQAPLGSVGRHVLGTGIDDDCPIGERSASLELVLSGTYHCCKCLTLLGKIERSGR